MIKVLLFLLPVCLMAEPVCPKCEVIREYNKEHPGFDGYYEDYLKKNPETKAQEAKSAEQKTSAL